MSETNKTTGAMPAATREQQKKRDLLRAQKREERKAQYAEACEKQRVFYWIAFALSIVLIACFFLDFTYITSSSGEYMGVNGWEYIIGLITGSFDSSSLAGGWLAVPYYYYGQIYVIITAICCLFVLIAAIATIVLLLIILLKKNYMLTSVALIPAMISTLFMVAVLVFGLLTAHAAWVSYCQRNTACIVSTVAYIPLVVSVILVGFAVYLCIRHTQAERILHPKRAKNQKAR